MGSHYIFIGGIWKKEDEQEIIHNSVGSVQIAANVFQTALIEGLDDNLGEPVTVLNEIFVGAFPKNYKKAYIAPSLWNHTNKKEHVDYNVGFLNFPLIKHFSRYLHLKKYIKKLCKTEADEKIYVIGYSMTYSVVEGLLYAKKINPKVTTCLIVPDLPQYMNLGKNRGFAFNLLRGMMSRHLYKSIKQVDSFVTLTKYIYEALNVSAPYTVVEGIASEGAQSNTGETQKRTRDFVYTGSLAQKYGVTELVDAFTKVEGDDLRLVICGAGDGLEHIQSVAARDPRIQYCGVVSNEEARRIQQNAYVLVNPRSNKEEYTKYSFPSKTMEYMATGRPVLMYKLAGVPEEYDEFLIYVKKDLYTSLLEIVNREPSELDLLGVRAKSFILQSKNSLAQTSKIISLFEKVRRQNDTKDQ